MAVFNEPAQWDHTLGNNADASTLPDDSAATAGTASLQKLFQLINATPLEAGGIAPDREDVNALFKYLGDQIFYTQNGGIPSYNAAYDYVAGRVVSYNGNLYKCIQANGASSTVVAPDSNTAYWQRLDNFVRSINGVNPDAQGNVQTGFPSSSFITHSLPNDDTGGSIYFTAPANGFIFINGQTNNEAFQSTTTRYILAAGAKLSAKAESMKANEGIMACMPVAKGDTVRFYTFRMQSAAYKFIYAIGEEP